MDRKDANLPPFQWISLRIGVQLALLFTFSLAVVISCVYVWDYGSYFDYSWYGTTNQIIPSEDNINLTVVRHFMSTLENESNQKFETTCSQDFVAALRNYSTFHGRSIEIMRQSPSSKEAENVKFIIWKCLHPEDDDCAGLADRLQGIVTTFLIAMATGRVMLIDWKEAHSVFDFVSFNWTYDSVLIRNKTIGGVGGCELCHKFCDDFFPTEDCMNNDPESLRDDVIVVASGKSMAHIFFSHPSYLWWRDSLLAVGLTRDYAFGCVMR